MNPMTREEFNIKFGKRILQLRKRAEFTQTELALRAGYKDKQTISLIETKGGNLKVDTLLSLANAFNIPLSELLDFTKLDT